jgi:hypothetical protein
MFNVHRNKITSRRVPGKYKEAIMFLPAAWYIRGGIWHRFGVGWLFWRIELWLSNGVGQ